jgi:polysaccharide export outer membrane protein
MRQFACILALALTLLLAPAVWADTPATSDYLLGPDDVIDISVDNHPDMNKTLTVLSDGKISFPEAGVILASGKTPTQLAADIQTELEKTLNNCNVTVSVKEVHSRRIRITGGVKQGGGFDYKPNYRLMDLIALAGGLDVKPVRVIGHLVRANQQVLTLDIPKAVEKPDSDANVPLLPDDLVLLDEIDIIRQVHVLGEVTKPGPYDLTENQTVVSLVSEAGPPTDKAALSKAYVMRSGTQIPMNLLPILEKNTPDPNVTNFKLQPGDVLFIPEIEQRYAVLGQVSKPGYFPILEKRPTTVLDALSLAGGQTPDGDLKKASILHEVNGKPVAQPINIEDMLKKGKLTANVALADGDVLLIPAKSKHNAMSGVDLYYGLGALSLLGLRL